MRILKDGQPITATTPGGAPVYVPGFETTPAARSDAVQGMPGRMLQIRQDGVDIGNDRPAVLDLIFPAASATATRGVGQNSHILTLRKLPPLDPLWLDVLLLVQGGTIEDQSSYSHPMTIIGSGVTENVVLADVPGGLGVQIHGTQLATGIQITPIGTEFNQGNTQARCYEWFYQIQVGVINIGSQVVFTDSGGLNGNTVYTAIDLTVPYTTSKLAIRLSSGSELPAPVGVAQVVVTETWFCAVQIPANGVDFIKYWTGRVSDGVAVGQASILTAGRPISAVNSGPWIGFVGASGGTNNYKLGPYRITAGVRYTEDNITIPTALFPVVA